MPEITQSEIQFLNNINEITTCDFYYSEQNSILNSKSKPLVLFLHGFRAFRNWGFFPYFAQQIASNNLIACCIDFSLNSLESIETQWFNMERFRRNTVTQMINEAYMLLNNLHMVCINNAFINQWNGDVYLIGHSLGGALAIALADRCSLVKKLTTICSIFDFDIYTERQKEKWIQNKTKEFIDSTTEQNIILDVEFLTDRLTYAGDKSILSMVKRLSIPYYIIHTEADATVNPKAAELLAEATTETTLYKKEIVPKGNHLLNCVHPFTASNPVLEHIIKNVLIFSKTTT